MQDPLWDLSDNQRNREMKLVYFIKRLGINALENESTSLATLLFHWVIKLEVQVSSLQVKQRHMASVVEVDREMRDISERPSSEPTSPPVQRTALMAGDSCCPGLWPCAEKNSV